MCSTYCWKNETYLDYKITQDHSFAIIVYPLDVIVIISVWIMLETYLWTADQYWQEKYYLSFSLLASSPFRQQRRKGRHATSRDGILPKFNQTPRQWFSYMAYCRVGHVLLPICFSRVPVFPAFLPIRPRLEKLNGFQFGNKVYKLHEWIECNLLNELNLALFNLSPVYYIRTAIKQLITTIKTMI